MLDDNYTVNIVINEIKKLENLDKILLRIEAKINNDIKTSSVIKVENESAVVDEKFSWTFTKRQWKDVKLMRTPIKVNLYIINDANGTEDVFGYSVIDLPSIFSTNRVVMNKIHGTKQVSSPILQCHLKVAGSSLRNSCRVPEEKKPSRPSNDSLPLDSDSLDLFANLYVTSIENLSIFLDEESASEAALVVKTSPEGEVFQRKLKNLDFEEFPRGSFICNFKADFESFFGTKFDFFLIMQKRIMAKGSVDIMDLIGADIRQDHTYTGQCLVLSENDEKACGRVNFGLSVSATPQRPEVCVEDLFLSRFPDEFEEKKFCLEVTFSEVSLDQKQPVEVEFDLQFYLCYQYSSMTADVFAGSSDVIRLNNAKTVDKLTPHSDNFTFVANPKETFDYLKEEHLNVQLKTIENNELIAEASLKLSSILEDEAFTTKGRLLMPINLFIDDSNGDYEKVFNLLISYRISLQVLSDKNNNQRAYRSEGDVLESDENLIGLKSPHDVADIRETIEYRKALELELWKSNAEEEFEILLEKRENELLDSLSREYKCLEKFRRDIFEKKFIEIERTEKSLKVLLNNLNKREKLLASEELKFNEVKQNHDSQMRLFRVEMESTSQRKIKEFQQNIQLQRQQTEYWKNYAEKSDKKVSLLEKELSRMKQSSKGKDSRPQIPVHSKEDQQPVCNDQLIEMKMEVVKLQIELGSTRNELDTMTRKCSSINTMAGNYRQMWCRAIQEVSRLKGESEKKLNEIIKAKDEEILKVREKTLHTDFDGQKMYPKPRSIINNQNNSLPLDENLRVHFEDEILSDLAKINDQRKCSDNDLIIQRLINERTNLLQSGNYTIHDDLIKDLDDEIKNILGNSLSQPDQNNNNADDDYDEMLS